MGNDEPENIANLKREVEKLENEKKEKEEMERTEKESMELKKKKAQLEFQKTKLYQYEKGAVEVGKKAVGWIAKKGEEITRPKPQQSHPVTQQAKAVQERMLQNRQVVTHQAVQSPQGFKMPDFGGFLGQSSPAPTVRAKIQVQRRKRLKTKVKRSYKNHSRKTIPRIRRMPRSPRVVKQKSFNINDVLKGLPQ